jgi:hypothetical protein
LVGPLESSFLKMPKKRRKAEEIVAKLRQVEVSTAQGQTVPWGDPVDTWRKLHQRTLAMTHPPSWPGIAVRRTASLPLAYARPSPSLIWLAFEGVDARDI